MPTASIRFVRSWKECGLNADMAFGAEFDPKRTSLPRMAERGVSGTWFLAVFTRSNLARVPSCWPPARLELAARGHPLVYGVSV